LTFHAEGDLPRRGYLMDALGNEVLNFEINSSEKIVDLSIIQAGISWLKIGDASKRLIIR
jgi:hypothetical protein